MRAQMIEGLRTTALRDVPEPRPGPGDVLLAVRHVGLCGSDLNTFNGLNPLVALPRIPGHEIGAEIIAAGPEVPPDYAPGRRVVVVPYTACGTCPSCRRGRVNACRGNRTLGVQQDGGLAERIALPHGKLILNDDLPPARLALVEPLSVGFHAVARGRVTAEDTVVVLGCGMIGMGAVIGAVARGARVIAVDVGDKASIAAAFGAAATLDAAEGRIAEEVAALTKGDGADVVIEAAGIPETFVQAVDLAGFSGRVVTIGYAKAPVTFETKWFNLKELDFLGSRNALREDFEAVIDHLRAAGDGVDRLISKVFPFEEAAEALPYWQRERGSTLKIVVAAK